MTESMIRQLRQHAKLEGPYDVEHYRLVGFNDEQNKFILEDEIKWIENDAHPSSREPSGFEDAGP
jgi:hypothetical protein